MTLSTRRFEQTRPLKSGRQLTALRHLLLLTLLALGTAATPAGASRDPSAGWSAELKVVTAVAPGMRPIDEFPGQLRLPNRDDATVQHLAVQSATYGLRPSPRAGPPSTKSCSGRRPSRASRSWPASSERPARRSSRALVVAPSARTIALQPRPTAPTAFTARAVQSQLRCSTALLRLALIVPRPSTASAPTAKAGSSSFTVPPRMPPSASRSTPNGPARLAPAA